MVLEAFTCNHCGLNDRNLDRFLGNLCVVDCKCAKKKIERKKDIIDMHWVDRYEKASRRRVFNLCKKPLLMCLKREFIIKVMFVPLYKLQNICSMLFFFLN